MGWDEVDLAESEKNKGLRCKPWGRVGRLSMM